MSLRMPTALFVLVAVFSLSSGVSAAPVPVDFTGGAVYPQPGLTIDNHVYYFNVTSYANISMDLRDMLIAVDAGNYAEAQNIYVKGKNAWRSLTSSPPNPRNAEPVIQRNYTTTAGYIEPWWAIASTYYNETVNSTGKITNGSLYLDRPISDAMTASGDFSAQGRFAAYRPQMLKAWLRFYPTLYYYHEMDAGWTAAMANPANVRGIFSEFDHGVGCYTGVTPRSTELNTVRVAPGYTPWEMSEELGSFWCTTGQLIKKHNKKTKMETTSQVNLQFLAYSQQLSNQFVPGGVPVTAVDPSALLALRLQQLRNINLNQIQSALQAVYQAGNGKLCNKDDKACKVAQSAAEAYAHWSMAQPALNFMGVPKGQLQAIEGLLNPAVWRVTATDNAALRAHYKQTVLAIVEATGKAGYMWSQIAGCKLGAKQVSTLSVKAASVDFAPEGDVAAVAATAAVAEAPLATATAVDAGDVVTAGALAAAAEPMAAAAAAAAPVPEENPVAAALAAVAAMVPGAGGENADPTEDGR